MQHAATKKKNSNDDVNHQQQKSRCSCVATPSHVEEDVAACIFKQICCDKKNTRKLLFVIPDNHSATTALAYATAAYLTRDSSEKCVAYAASAKKRDLFRTQLRTALSTNRFKADITRDWKGRIAIATQTAVATCNDRSEPETTVLFLPLETNGRVRPSRLAHLHLDLFLTEGHDLGFLAYLKFGNLPKIVVATNESQLNEP